MTTEEFHRKLTAILSADVAGYSRLMGEDEEATVLTLNKYKEMIFGLIQRHNGRLVDSPGDNLLAEFSSVVDAVRCGVQIQEDLKENNEGLPPNRKMEFRIGINIGDVIQDGDRIYGDGVNVAARIESLADPGGICISRTAYDQVKSKINIDYDYLGEYEVKNIKEPVRVYRIRMETEGAIVKEKKARLGTWEWAALVVAVFILGAVAIWYFSFRQAPVVKEVEEAPKTIAVLPFVNLSSDPEQEYFVDGLSEELLNTLTQIPDLLVTGRTSSFSFKGKDKTVQEIASILGVENILEGSVRKAGNELRITAQLLRGADGFHLWSKEYDRELKDIFAVQEDIATAVANELKLTLGIDKSFKQLGGTDNLEAYELYLIAQGQIINDDLATINRAQELIDEAIALDHEFALAWSFKANIHILKTVHGPANLADFETDEGLYAVQKAIELEPNLPEAYLSFGAIKMSRGQWIEAESDFRKAFQLSTESVLADVVQNIVVHYLAVGNFKRALELIKEMRRKDPLNENIRYWYIYSLNLMGDTQRAEEEYERCRGLFGAQWGGAHWYISSIVRPGVKFPVPLDEIPETVMPYSVFAIAWEHFESPEKGLIELHRIYDDDENLSGSENISISWCAAYLGDPEFALEAMEKAYNIHTSSAFHFWTPVMHKVRQLPRFKKFVKDIGLVDYWNKFGWPDICHELDNGDFECQ